MSELSQVFEALDNPVKFEEKVAAIRRTNPRSDSHQPHDLSYRIELSLHDYKMLDLFKKSVKDLVVQEKSERMMKKTRRLIAAAKKRTLQKENLARIRREEERKQRIFDKLAKNLIREKKHEL